MKSLNGVTTSSADKTNWMWIVNCIAKQGMRYRRGLRPDEVRSLAAVAVAKALANYRPSRAKGPVRQWVNRWAGRLLLSEMRQEISRRNRSVRASVFTDIGGDSGCLAGGCAQELLPPAPRDDALALLELEDMLAAFPARDRHIAILRSQQWTLQQIGMEVGLSAEAVRLRLRGIGAVLMRRRWASA